MWLGARALAAVYLAVNNMAPLPSSQGATLFFVLLTVAACFADVHLRRERVLIGNLGASLWTVAGISAIPPLLAEMSVLAAVALLS
jgi:hypothetical protein